MIRLDININTKRSRFSWAEYKSREADYIAGVDGQCKQKKRNVRFNYNHEHRILIVHSSDSARATTPTVQEKRN